MNHTIMHGCNALTMAWYQTAVKIGSAPGEQETEVESSDIPGPSGLSFTGLSNETELYEQEKTYNLMAVRILVYTCTQLTICVIADNIIMGDSRAVPGRVDPNAHNI